MEEENEVKWDKSRWLIMALVVVICWLMFRKIVRNAVRRMWLRLDSFLLDQFSVNYNKRMHSRKKALLFDGLSQMTKDAGRPLRVLEVGVGTGANFAYYPDGTTVACVDPSAEYSDRLQKNAERFPGIHLELHRGFAEDMAMIESGSIDAVTSTMVMCCVRDIDKCLKEIIRILRPGGKFFFMEHVCAKKGTAVYHLQQLVGIPFYHCLGCNLTNKSYENIQQAEFDTVELDAFEAKEIVHPTAIHLLAWLVTSHISGVATK